MAALQRVGGLVGQVATQLSDVLKARGLVMCDVLPEVMDAESRNGRLTLELCAEAEVAPVITMLVASGVSVEEVRRGKASLEDVFLTLMEEEK